MEKRQDLGDTLDDLGENLGNSSIVLEMGTSMLVENSNEQTQKENQTVTEEMPQDTTLQELEVSKCKLKDNLSGMCNEKIEDIIKTQMRADITIKCVKKELESAIDSTTKLEEIATECEFQQDYLQNRLDMERADRTQLVKEMDTMGSIVEILTEKLITQEIVLEEYKSEMISFMKAADDILNQDNLEEEAFQKQFEANERELREWKEKLVATQNQLDEQNKSQLAEKIVLEQDIENLERDIAIAKAKNIELRKEESALEREKEDSWKSLLELKAKLDSIPLEETRKRLTQQQDENREKINRKMIEVEVLNQRMNDRLGYLNEINKELESAEEEHKKLIEESTQCKDELTKAEAKHDSLEKELVSSRLNYRKDLESLSKIEKELRQKIEPVDSNITTVINDRAKIETETKALNEESQNLQSTISRLESEDKECRTQLKEQIELNQSYLSKFNTLTEEATALDEETARLDAEKLQTESDLEVLQHEAEIEMKRLESELNEAKEMEIEVLRQESELEDAKVEGERKLTQMREENLTILKEMEDTLQQLKNQETSDAIILKELSEKLQVKTINRDSLHKKYKTLKKEIQRLEKEAAAEKKAKEEVSVQKPMGILKNPNAKSPQKKVTFNQNVAWDSESSTEAFFDRILKKNSTINEPSKKETIDEIFDMLKTNSPPEHEG